MKKQYSQADHIQKMAEAATKSGVKVHFYIGFNPDDNLTSKINNN